jgi:hypothetical protein
VPPATIRASWRVERAGNGQFRDGGGEIIKEESFVHYKDEFEQESVLRVDDPFAVRISF